MLKDMYGKKRYTRVVGLLLVILPCFELQINDALEWNCTRRLARLPFFINITVLTFKRLHNSTQKLYTSQCCVRQAWQNSFAWLFFFFLEHTMLLKLLQAHSRRQCMKRFAVGAEMSKLCRAPVHSHQHRVVHVGRGRFHHECMTRLPIECRRHSCRTARRVVNIVYELGSHTCRVKLQTVKGHYSNFSIGHLQFLVVRFQFLNTVLLQQIQERPVYSKAFVVPLSNWRKLRKYRSVFSLFNRVTPTWRHGGWNKLEPIHSCVNVFPTAQRPHCNWIKGRRQHSLCTQKCSALSLSCVSGIK
jgi:hypothetical protein